MKCTILSWLTVTLLVVGCHKKPPTLPTPGQDVPPSQGVPPSQEVRPCYAPELAQNPTLQGDVAITFEIAASGQVHLARVLSTSLRNANVELCTIAMINRWKISNPNGAVLNTKMTFHFRPSEITTGP